MTQQPPLNQHQLVNHFGITDPGTLREAEALLVTVAEVEGVPAGAYDIDHLAHVHRHLFGDLYPWAGSLRTAKLPSELVDIAGLRNAMGAIVELDPSTMNATAFATAVADAYLKIMTVSPFPHGNGRAARAILGKFADDHGMSIRWDLMSHSAHDAALRTAKESTPGDLRDWFVHITQHRDLFAERSVDGIHARVVQISAAIGLDESAYAGALLPSAGDLQALAAGIREATAAQLTATPTVSLEGKWSRTGFHSVDAALGDSAPAPIAAVDYDRPAPHGLTM